MRITLTACMIAALALASGCSKAPQSADKGQTDEQAGSEAKEPKKPQQAKPEPGGMPLDYVNTAVKQPKRVAKQLSSLAMTQAVQAYQALEGRLPKSLDELKKSGFEIPPPPKGTQYKYDPKTGKVELVDK